jgi:hypothetical protein
MLDPEVGSPSPHGAQSDSDSEELHRGRVPAAWAEAKPPPPLAGCEWWQLPLWRAFATVSAQRGKPTRPMTCISKCNGMALEEIGFQAARVHIAWQCIDRMLMSTYALHTCALLSYGTARTSMLVNHSRRRIVITCEQHAGQAVSNTADYRQHLHCILIVRLLRPRLWTSRRCGCRAATAKEQPRSFAASCTRTSSNISGPLSLLCKRGLARCILDGSAPLNQCLCRIYPSRACHASLGRNSASGMASRPGSRQRRCVQTMGR